MSLCSSHPDSTITRFGVDVVDEFFETNKKDGYSLELIIRGHQVPAGECRFSSETLCLKESLNTRMLGGGEFLHATQSNGLVVVMVVVVVFCVPTDGMDVFGNGKLITITSARNYHSPASVVFVCIEFFFWYSFFAGVLPFRCDCLSFASVTHVGGCWIFVCLLLQHVSVFFSSIVVLFFFSMNPPVPVVGGERRIPAL